MIAKVIIDISHNAVDQTYDYIVPLDLEDQIQTGMRVQVPFSNGIRIGMVMGFKKTTSRSNLKEVTSLLDDEKVISEPLLEAAMLLKKKYATPLFEVLNLVIPEFKRFKKTKTLTLLNPKERYASFFNGRTHLKFNKKLPEVIKQGIQDNDILLNTSFSQKGVLRQDIYYQLTRDKTPLNASQEKVIDWIQKNGPQTKKALMNALNISSSPIETMVKKGQLEAFLVPKYLNKTRDLNKGPSFKEVSVKEHVEISETLKNHKTILLTGASHETLDALAFKVTLERPTQRKLFILPEIFMIEAIALKMSQEIEVTVYHSKMSSSEKKDSYERFLNGTLCLTTPSGFFLDLDHTDLVIVTHAHDPAYQSLERPRFDVITDSLNLQERFNYELMLVSKTLPASLYQDKIHSVHIGEESFKINTHIVDLRPHVLHHPNRLITGELDEVIQKTLNHNQNVLLIHHQKGGYKQLRCAQCGTSYVCDQCLNVATLKEGTPFCETCQIPLEKSVCETCLKPYQAIDPGLDILKEEVINQYHVETEIITSESTDFLERYLVKTSPRIILGTKTIMRALDFYKIGCVGIIQMEDLVMGHAYDEAWVMISELLEANERLNKGFDFVIQTYDINQRVFKDLNQPDIFFENELKTYQKLELPPYKKMIQVLLKGSKPKRMIMSSHVMTYLKKAFRDHATYLGPLHHANISIITIKGDDLMPYYGSLNALVKTFSEDIEIEIRHFKFRK